MTLLDAFLLPVAVIAGLIFAGALVVGAIVLYGTIRMSGERADLDRRWKAEWERRGRA